MKLRKYIARRLLIRIPTFFISSIVIFSFVRIAPGDPLMHMYRAGTIMDPSRIREV